MKIEQRKVDSLIPYVNNSRKHSDEQVAQIAASIKEFGWTNPILVDGKNGIIAGHGRLMAARKLGMVEIPVIELAHLSEPQRKALIIADNKLALNASWDDDLLSLELKDLKIAGYDLLMTGFSFDEINKLADESTEGLTDEDEIPIIKENPKTKIGDIYKLGNHILMCGDSTNEKDVAKLVSYFGDAQKHCISDPPYGIAYDPKISKYGMIMNDDVFLDYIALAKKYTNGFFFMWTSYQVVDEWIKRVREDFNKITNLIIWHKGGGGWAIVLKPSQQIMK